MRLLFILLTFSFVSIVAQAEDLFPDPSSKEGLSEAAVPLYPENNAENRDALLAPGTLGQAINKAPATSSDSEEQSKGETTSP